MSGLLVLQSDVAKKVAEALALKLLPADEARLANVRNVDAEAYEAYLKAVRSMEALSKAGFDEAERSFNLAIEKEPGYAAPWAGLAGLWVSRIQLGMASREEGLLIAKSAALKAIALDDGETEARRVLAGILTWLDWDWPAAERAWNRLFEIDPDNAMGLPGYSHFLMVTRRLDEALAKSERAVELGPYNVRTQSFRAQVLLGALFMKGRFGELMDLERARAGDRELLEALEEGYREGGVYGAALTKFSKIFAARYGKPGGPRGYHLANCFARAGDKESTIEWLEMAYEEHDNNMPYTVLNPAFDLVRDDPRFQDLLRRMNLPPGDEK